MENDKKQDKQDKNYGKVLHNIFNTESYEIRHNLVFIKTDDGYYFGRFRTRSEHFNVILKNCYYCPKKTDKRSKYKVEDFSQFPRVLIRKVNLELFDLGVKADHDKYPDPRLFLKFINNL